MKRLRLLLAAGLLLVACQKNEAGPQEPEDPDWLRLEIPTTWSADEAYAIVGDIDKTLLVSNVAEVYATSDRGRTWQISHNFQGTVRGLLLRNDTIFAFRAASSPTLDDQTARLGDYFTADFGKTWEYTGRLPKPARYDNLSQPIGRVAAAGVAYRTKVNTEPAPNAHRLLASDLVRTDGAGQTTLRLPTRHYLNNLHLDGQNRLYVAASSYSYDPVTGAGTSKPVAKTQPVVYVSRRPLP